MYGQPRRLVISMSQSLDPSKFLMRERKLNHLLDGLVWGAGVPVQQDIWDNVQRTASKGILKQITSLCIGNMPQNDASMQALWLLYYEAFFRVDKEQLRLNAPDVNTMCTWDYSALGRELWEFIHYHGDRL